MMDKRIVACGVVALAVLAAGARGDDFNPPWWVDLDNNRVRDHNNYWPDWQAWPRPPLATAAHWAWAGGPYAKVPIYELDAWYEPDHYALFYHLVPDGMPEVPRQDGAYAAVFGPPRGKVSGDAIYSGTILWNVGYINGGPATATFEIPLYDVPGEKTLMRIQYGGTFGPSAENLKWHVSAEGFIGDQVIPGVRVFHPPFDGTLGTTIYYNDWEFAGAPHWIRVTMTIDGNFSAALDQVHIDTLTIIPEPTALAGLVMGVALLRRRNRA